MCPPVEQNNINHEILINFPLQREKYIKSLSKKFLRRNFSSNHLLLKIALLRVSMGLTVNRQMAKILTVNRQKRNIFFRQPSNERAKISRQISQIPSVYHLKGIFGSFFWTNGTAL